VKQYYRLLGLEPGAGPEEIKKAFRDQIKLCHPDRSSGESEKARELIEAYNYLKENHTLHTEEKRKDPSPENYRSDKDFNAKEAGKRAGERIFQGIFRERSSFADRKPPIRDYYDPLDFLKKRQESVLPLDRGEVMLYRAEMALREVVQKYNRQMKTRSRRSWSREYIGKLVNIQVLFRDICVRYPGLSFQATSRLKQIQELIAEVKQMAHF